MNIEVVVSVLLLSSLLLVLKEKGEVSI